MSSKSVDQFLAELRVDPAASVQPLQVKQAQPRQWRALMGQVLEYGDTGFQIVLLKHGNAQRPFQLRDPEGRVMGEGDNLEVMKRVAQDQARMRDEFSAVDTQSFSTMPRFGTSHEGQ